MPAGGGGAPLNQRDTSVPLDVLFGRLAAEMRQLECDGLRLEGWITHALEERDVVTPQVSAALQNLDRLLQTLVELGLLFDVLARDIEAPPILDLHDAMRGVRLRDLTEALVGAAPTRTAERDGSGEVDLF